MILHDFFAFQMKIEIEFIHYNNNDNIKLLFSIKSNRKFAPNLGGEMIQFHMFRCLEE